MTKIKNLKQTFKNFSGSLLIGTFIVGGIASATFDFTTLPGLDKIRTGEIIRADDILSLSTALGTLDQRTANFFENVTTGDDGIVNFTNGLTIPTYATEADLPDNLLEGAIAFVTGSGLFAFDGAEWATTGGGVNISDSNNDGLPDAWANEYNVSNANADNDSDGATNLQEFIAGTNPTVVDSDGGGESDGHELAAGRNPNDGSDDVASPDGLPSGISFKIPKYTFIASVHDNNYLPIANPDEVEDPVVDIQGVLDTTGREILLSYIANASVEIPEFSQTIIVPAEKTENGIATPINLSYPAQTISGRGKVVATLKAVNEPLNVKKLDIDQNFQRSDWLTLADFTLALDEFNEASIKFIVAPGVPDAKFGIETNGVYEHDFLYMPVVAPDGSIWLNNQLGALYSNTHSEFFNPTQQATYKLDYKGYGSSFQWGRPADGHELINYTGEKSGASKYSQTYDPFDSISPSSNKFVRDLDWTTADDDGALRRKAWLDGIDPCPNAYHIPSASEVQNAFTAEDLIDHWNPINFSCRRYHESGSQKGYFNCNLVWVTNGYATSVQRDTNGNVLDANTGIRGDSLPIICIQD